MAFKNCWSLTIVRDKVPIYSLDAAHMVDDKVGYIKVSRFAKTTMDEFRQSHSGLTRARACAI